MNSTCCEKLAWPEVRGEPIIFSWGRFSCSFLACGYLSLCSGVLSCRLCLEASWSHQLSAQALHREGSWKAVWNEGKAEYSESPVPGHTLWESVGLQRGRNTNQTVTPWIGCLLCASPGLSAFDSHHVRNPPATQGGTYYSCPCFTHENIGTHTAGMWQIQHLNSRLLPTTALISQAMNIFGSAHKRETRKG